MMYSTVSFPDLLHGSQSRNETMLVDYCCSCADTLTLLRERYAIEKCVDTDGGEFQTFAQR